MTPNVGGGAPSLFPRVGLHAEIVEFLSPKAQIRLANGENDLRPRFELAKILESRRLNRYHGWSFVRA